MEGKGQLGQSPKLLSHRMANRFCFFGFEVMGSKIDQGRIHFRSSGKVEKCSPPNIVANPVDRKPDHKSSICAASFLRFRFRVPRRFINTARPRE